MIQPPDELLAGIARVELPGTEMRWKYEHVRLFAEYCSLVLSSLPEELRDRANATWRRNNVSLLLIQQSVAVRHRSGERDGTQRREDAWVICEDRWLHDDLLVAGWWQSPYSLSVWCAPNLGDSLGDGMWSIPLSSRTRPS